MIRYTLCTTQLTYIHIQHEQKDVVCMLSLRAGPPRLVLRAAVGRQMPFPSAQIARRPGASAWSHLARVAWRLQKHDSACEITVCDENDRRRRRESTHRVVNKACTLTAHRPQPETIVKVSMHWRAHGDDPVPSGGERQNSGLIRAVSPINALASCARARAPLCSQLYRVGCFCTHNRLFDCHCTRLNEPRGHTAAHARIKTTAPQSKGC